MTQATDRIDLKEKLTLFDELWTPKLVAKVNARDVTLSKIPGEFVWHHQQALETFGMSEPWRARSGSEQVLRGRPLLFDHAPFRRPRAEGKKKMTWARGTPKEFDRVKRASRSTDEM